MLSEIGVPLDLCLDTIEAVSVIIVLSRNLILTGLVGKIYLRDQRSDDQSPPTVIRLR